MKNLGPRIGWVALGRSINTLSLLLINIILSRTLSENTYGQYQQIWLIVKIAIPIFLFGFPISLNFFLPTRPERERSRFVSQTSIILVSLAVIFCVGLFVLAPRIANFGGFGGLVPLLRMAAIIGMTFIGSGFWEPLLINYNRHKWLTISLFIFGLMHLTAVLLGRFVGQSLFWIFTATTIFALFRFAIIFGVSWQLIRPVTRPLKRIFNRATILKQIKYTWPIGLHDGIDIISRWADKLIVTAFFTPGQFAIYFNGALELPVVDLIIQSIRAVVLPDFAAAYHKNDNSEIVRLLHLTAYRIAILIFPLTIFSLIIAPDLMVLLYGETYRNSGYYFRIFAFFLPIRISTATSVLLAVGRSEKVLYGTILDVILAFSMGIFLIPWLGLSGPPIALIFSTYCQSIYYLWQVKKAIATPMADLMPWAALGKLGILSIAVGGLSSFAPIFDRSLLNIMLTGIIFCGGYLSGGYFLKIFDVEIRKAIRQFLLKIKEYWTRSTGKP